MVNVHKTLSIDDKLVSDVNKVSDNFSEFTLIALKNQLNPKVRASSDLRELQEKILIFRSRYPFLKVEFRVYNLDNKKDVESYNRFKELLTKGLQYEKVFENKTISEEERKHYGLELKQQEVLNNG